MTRQGVAVSATAGDSGAIPLHGVARHAIAAPDTAAALADLENMHPGPVRIVITDGIVTDVTAPSAQRDAIVGHAFANLVHPDDEVALKDLLQTSNAGIRSIRVGAADGVVSHFELSVESAVAGRIILTGWDVTTHARRQRALEQLALHDPLTGLANRLLFGERLHDELRRRRRTGQEMAVMYADLDGFKAVNDTWGHRAGDLLLVALATRVRACLRPGDVLARLGGDEFGICCPDIADHAAALVIAHRVVEEATAAFNLGGAVVRVSISVGVAMTNDDDVADHGGRLLARADLAMYAAKHSGKERVAVAGLDA
jgi:diguanylate cyclase (GGDEF)-like protein